MKNIKKQLNQYIVSCFFVLSIILIPVNEVHAKNISIQEKQALINELKELIAQLQKQILELQLKAIADQEVDNSKIQKLIDNTSEIEKVIFTKTEDNLGIDVYENIFSVNYDLELKSLDGNKTTSGDFLKVWDIARNIFGDELIRKSIREFRIFSDDDNSVLAFVKPSSADFRKWVLAVNLDHIDLDSSISRSELMEVYVHELAHVVSLDGSQVDYFYEDCKNKINFYRICLDENSYLSDFIKEFWTSNNLKRVRYFHEFESDDEYGSYIKNRFSDDRYVTPYSSSQPEEDFAESFVEFVFRYDQFESNKDIKDKKVLFFSHYEKLLKIKNDIRLAIGLR